MYDIQEHAVFAGAAGLSLNEERLERIATFVGMGDGNYTDCCEYHITHPENFGEDLLRLFRITPTLVQRWHSAGITFQIFFFTREGKLTGGRIIRRKTLPGDLFSVSYLTDPTRQEIRIAGRILRYLSEKDSKL